MAEIAPLRIVYIFDSGAETGIARGTIAHNGMMEITKIIEGQEGAVETLVSELNASERVYKRGARTSSETGRVTMSKKPVKRGSPGFLEALRETAKRFYKVDLRFDPAVFGGGELLMLDPEDTDTEDQIDDTPPGPDMTPVEDALPGLLDS